MLLFLASVITSRNRKGHTCQSLPCVHLRQVGFHLKFLLSYNNQSALKTTHRFQNIICILSCISVTNGSMYGSSVWFQKATIYGSRALHVWRLFALFQSFLDDAFIIQLYQSWGLCQRACQVCLIIIISHECRWRLIDWEMKVQDVQMAYIFIKDLPVIDPSNRLALILV